MHPVYNMVWFGVGNTLSSVQARETCQVMEEHAESMVTLRVKEQKLLYVRSHFPPFLTDSCVAGTELCHLAAYTGVFFLDRKPLTGLLEM